MIYEEINLEKEFFLQQLRSSAYKNIRKGKGGLTQWRRIVGIANRDKKGSLITLNKSTTSYLQHIVDYFNMTEGREELESIGVEIPEHVDDLVVMISNAKTYDQMRDIIVSELFRKFRKILKI